MTRSTKCSTAVAYIFIFWLIKIVVEKRTRKQRGKQRGKGNVTKRLAHNVLLFIGCQLSAGSNTTNRRLLKRPARHGPNGRLPFLRVFSPSFALPCFRPELTEMMHSVKLESDTARSSSLDSLSLSRPLVPLFFPFQKVFFPSPWLWLDDSVWVSFVFLFGYPRRYLNTGLPYLLYICVIIFNSPRTSHKQTRLDPRRHRHQLSWLWMTLVRA